MRYPNNHSGKFKEITKKTKPSALKIKILKTIAIDGNKSKTDLVTRLIKSKGTISETVDELVNKKKFDEGYIRYSKNPEDEKTTKSGRPQEYFGLTEKGILFLIDQHELNYDEFWKMILNMSDKTSEYYIPDEKHSRWIKSNIDFNRIISHYEKTILDDSVKQFLHPVFSHILNDLPFIYRDAKTKRNIIPVLEILGKYGNLSEDKIIDKIGNLSENKIIDKIGNNNIDDNTLKELQKYILVIRWNDSTISLSQFGLLLLFYHIYNKSKYNPECNLGEMRLAHESYRDEDIKNIFEEQEKFYEQKEFKNNSTKTSRKTINREIDDIISRHIYLFPDIFKLKDSIPEMDSLDFVHVFVLLFFRLNDLKYILPQEKYADLQIHEYKQVMYLQTVKDFFRSGMNCLLTWLKEHQVSPLKYDNYERASYIGVDSLLLSELDMVLHSGCRYGKFSNEDVIKITSIGRPIKLLYQLCYLLSFGTAHYNLGFSNMDEFTENVNTKSIQNFILFRLNTGLKGEYPQQIDNNQTIS